MVCLRNGDRPLTCGPSPQLGVQGKLEPSERGEIRPGTTGQNTQQRRVVHTSSRRDCARALSSHCFPQSHHECTSRFRDRVVGGNLRPGRRRELERSLSGSSAHASQRRARTVLVEDGQRRLRPRCPEQPRLTRRLLPKRILTSTSKTFGGPVRLAGRSTSLP